MPTTEAESVDEREPAVYELAFHILPTVAEEEVSSVFDSIKGEMTKAGGSLIDEEMPERFDLAYEIMKHLEGKNRNYHSAYFCWVRFSAPGSAIAELHEAVDSRPDILRTLLIKLTKAEEASPFRFHEALRSENPVVTIGSETEAEEVKVEVKEEVKVDNEEKIEPAVSPKLGE